MNTALLLRIGSSLLVSAALATVFTLGACAAPSPGESEGATESNLGTHHRDGGSGSDSGSSSTGCIPVDSSDAGAGWGGSDAGYESYDAGAGNDWGYDPYQDSYDAG